ncbi:SulP family inorganic anion transporter [Porphyromonas pogonae]|uniref:SulP family inorganic anion transporter n=1 Tax=Porphyromonas pogonae TaxID=867595 RepID=UPI002E7691C0|nr:sulfate permease [Porphyromonas pogonae]
MDKSSVFKPRFFEAVKQYNASLFAADAMAGIIVGIVALPLAIAFAIASGVAPEVGLITAIIGGFIVAMFGGSSVQIGGPTGAFIIIVYGIIQEFGIQGLLVATFIAGLLLLVMGVLKLGSLIKFIPYPIVIGFTAGIALTIFSTQMNDLLGLGLKGMPAAFIPKWGMVLENMDKFNWIALVIGIVSITIIQVTPRFTKKIPGSLIAIILMTVVVYWLRTYQGVQGIETIGDRFTISASISMPDMPQLGWTQIQQLITPAFTIAMLGAIESLLSASVADGVTGDRHDSNTELIAQGLANIAVPFVGGIPVTGAIARTMTNINNGGKTPVAGVIHALILLLIFLFLGPLTAYIPMACLSGVLIVVSYNMSGWRSVRSLFKGPKSDTAVMMITFLLTVLVDLTVAIEIGLIFSMLFFMKRMVESTNILVSKDVLELHREGDDVAKGKQVLELPHGVEVYEIEGPYFFGIANRFDEAMREAGDRAGVRIIRMRFVPFMDSTAIHNLKTLCRTCQSEGVKLIFSGVNDKVRQSLEQTGVADMVGRQFICRDINEAVEVARTIV